MSKKRERNDSRLIVTLEPQKGRDDTQPQAVILDTASLSVEFSDFFLYDLNDEKKQALAKLILLTKLQNKG